jgi:hypothetical protein
MPIIEFAGNLNRRPPRLHFLSTFARPTSRFTYEPQFSRSCEDVFLYRGYSLEMRIPARFIDGVYFEGLRAGQYWG